MRARVSSWGGSVAIRLPKKVVESLGLSEGEDVELSLGDQELTVRPARPVYELRDLVAEAKGLAPPEPWDDGPLGAEEL